MGQTSSSGSSNSSPEHIVSSLHDEVLRHARIITGIATLTYEDFQMCLGELNALSKKVTDHKGKQLIFAVKKGTDSTVLWKGTVVIACVKLDPKTKEIESYRLVNLTQFLNIFKTLQCQMTAALQSSESEMHGYRSYVETELRKKVEETNSDSGSTGSNDSSYHESVSENSNSSTSCEKRKGGTEDGEKGAATSSQTASRRPRDLKLADTKRMTASMLLEEVDNLTYCFAGDGGDKIAECCICFERKPDVMLPCAHAYCLPCIEEWNSSHKTCPICRDTLNSTDDTWVISDIPGSQEINEEICSALMDLTTSPD